jgi:hypothetical protein
VRQFLPRWKIRGRAAQLGEVSGRFLASEKFILKLFLIIKASEKFIFEIIFNYKSSNLFGLLRRMDF